jgi:Protein of unknown function (DUF3152)
MGEQFAGAEFRKVASSTGIMGSGGTLYTYTIYVQVGLGIRRADVARRVDATLASDRGWTRSGRVRFQRLAANANTDVFVAAPDQVDILCAPLDTAGEVSCCQGRRVVLNADRWREAVPHWTGSVRSYREALIQHEFGHRIGQGHRSCEGAGRPHPIMMQFSYGLQGCRCHSWPLDYEVASL